MPPKKRCTFGAMLRLLSSYSERQRRVTALGGCKQWLHRYCAVVPAKVNKTHLKICSPGRRRKKAIFVLSKADQSNTIKDI